MFDAHVEASAELYALGELDELEQARVDRHARACDACAKRLGEAEAAVLHLIENGTVPERSAEFDRRIRFARPPMRLPAWIAVIAAALVTGFLSWGVMSLLGREPTNSAAEQQLAMRAMLAGHFTHAPFVPHGAGAPAAKVVYARAGGWLYVIVAPGADPLDVVLIAGARRMTVASLPAATTVRSKFINQSARVKIVELVDKGVPVATAHIVYAAGTVRR